MLAVDIQYKYILQNVHSPTQRVHRNPPTGIYVPTFWGIHVSWRSSVHPSGAGLGNVHFVTYIFVSDICGQHLGDVCQLEVFCAPFGRRVRECIFFCNVYIGYMPPTFGEQMSVDFVHFLTLRPKGRTENLQLTYIPQMLAAFIQYKYIYYNMYIP